MTSRIRCHARASSQAPHHSTRTCARGHPRRAFALCVLQVTPCTSDEKFCVRFQPGQLSAFDWGAAPHAGWQLPRYRQHACRANDSLSLPVFLLHLPTVKALWREGAAVPPCRCACACLPQRWGRPGTPGDLACMRSVREDINGRPFHDIVYAAKCVPGPVPASHSSTCSVRVLCPKWICCCYFQGGEGPELVGPL